RMAGCQRALDVGFEAARASDAETHRLWAQLYSEEKVSGAWYRAKYGELGGKHPRSDALPTLEPGQVVRRAELAAPHPGRVACAGGWLADRRGVGRPRSLAAVARRDGTGRVSAVRA